MRIPGIIILCFIVFKLDAQVKFNGSVRDVSTGKGISGVNIMLQEDGNVTILEFSVTDHQGNYQVEYKGDQDSVIISASGFNIRKQTQRINNRSQELNFDVNLEAIALKEIRITPRKIRQRGDTINYLVDGYIDANDRTIGDVLKKMPGIEVKESGAIHYKDKPINKFYIDDMDLLQGRYGIASNNIEAKDVSTVQVLENHQPIKALKDKVLSDQAAINLKLKDSAKGVLTANAMLGAGGMESLLWNTELTSMYFQKGRQNITTYKSNNSGDDVLRDMNSFYSRDADNMLGDCFLNIQAPGMPSISRKRLLFNRTHNLSFNNLWKLNKEYQLNVNFHYINDRQDKNSFSRSQYFFPGDSSLIIEENLEARSYANNLSSEIQINANKKEFYLNNLVKADANWDKDRGNIAGSVNVFQKLNKPSYGVSNTFSFIRNYEKTILEVSSFNGFNSLPQHLTIKPLLYPELFDDSIKADMMRQNVSLQGYKTKNTISMGYKNNDFFKQNYAFGFNGEFDHLTSDLSTGLQASGFSRIIPDSLSNDIRRKHFEFRFNPSYTVIYEDLRANLSLPASFIQLNIDDQILKKNKKRERIYFDPVLFLQYKLSAFWDMNAYLTYKNNMGDLKKDYSGYIMQSYRNLVRNDGKLYETQAQNYNLRLMYRNPLRSLFGNVGITYFNNKSNMLYGYDYQGILGVLTSYEIPNHSEGINTSISLNKDIDLLSSTVKAGSSFSFFNSSNISQSDILRYENLKYNINAAINSKIESYASISYQVNYSNLQMKIRNEENNLKPVRNFTQNARLNIFPMKGLVIAVSFEHFYTRTESSDKNISFGDIQLKYKWKGGELILDYTNIFNSKEYISASYSDVSSYYNIYDLRPSEIMLKYRFKLK